MAKIDLNVHLENAKRDIAKLEKSGATANVKNSSRDMTELVNEIGSLLKISKPTNEQLRQISRAFKQLDNIIKAVADTGAFGTDIVGSFVNNTVAVEGANGYTAADYKVYVYTSGVVLGAIDYTVVVK